MPCSRLQTDLAVRTHRRRVEMKVNVKVMSSGRRRNISCPIIVTGSAVSSSFKIRVLLTVYALVPLPIPLLSPLLHVKTHTQAHQDVRCHGGASRDIKPHPCIRDSSAIGIP